MLLKFKDKLEVSIMVLESEANGNRDSWMDD